MRIEDRDETTGPAHLHVLRTQETSAVVKENTTNTSFVFLFAPKAKDTNHNSASGTFQKRTMM